MRRTDTGWNVTAHNDDIASQSPEASNCEQQLVDATIVQPPSQTGIDGVVDAVPGDTSTTFTVTVGGAGASGWISPVGDRDWYAVTLTAGQNYVFALSGSGGSPLQDTFLRLHDASGAQLVFDDDSGPATYSLLSYTAPNSGTFYLDAAAFGDSSTGQYTLSAAVAEGAPDSIAASTATTSTLSVGSSAYGSINTLGDHDWYGITLTAGQVYQFSLAGLGGSPLGNASLNLRDASGALIAEGASSSVNSLITFAATSSGVYYLDAGGANDASAGAYAMSAGAYNGFVVNLIYDASALAAPQSFRDGIQAAANILHSMIADNISVSLNISYSGTGGGASAGPDGGLIESYSQIRDLLVNTAAPGDHTFDALPSGSTIGGQSQVVVWNAELRALGLMATNNPASDGSATFSTDINPALLVGVALHELTHALGRVQNAPQPDILEFFRFTSAGTRLFDDHTPASSSSYFSIDGGVTRLANFGVNSDPSDFLNTGMTVGDPFNEFYNSNTLQDLTTNDLQVLDALGFHVFFANGPDLIAQSGVVSGSQFSFTVRDLGNASAGASMSGIYLSSDSSITTSDTLITTSAASALPSYGSDHRSVALTFTGAQAPGVYYLGVIADYDGANVEANETNNASSAVPVILGDNNANTVNGTAGADSMFALGGNDTLVGGFDNDTLNGGLGVDTANYASASTSDSWHRNPDGSWTIIAGAEGTDTLTSVEFAHFTDRDLHLANARETFTGDGTSDILFRGASGEVVSWEVSGTSLSSSAFLGSVGNEWSVQTTGDFNGDSHDDILWRRNDGVTYIWEMNGSSIAAAALTAVQPGLEWSILGAGDFNGDGRDDILWRRTDGVTYLWQMDSTGFGVSNAGPTSTQAGLEWSVAAFADFNGDGREDILWRNTSGVSVIWEMNGSNVIASGLTAAQPGLEWNVAGTGDFNGDGRDDILWRRDDGLTVIWEMNGLSIAHAAPTTAQPGNEWAIAGVGDYNGDGKDDILWRNDLLGGLIYVWLMNGETVTQAGAINAVGNHWEIVGGG